MANFKKGDYIKGVGGDMGIAWNGKEWVSYQCQGCAIATGLIVPAQRLSNGDHPKPAKRIGYNYVLRHDVKIHNEWLAAGKPVLRGS